MLSRSKGKRLSLKPIRPTIVFSITITTSASAAVEATTSEAARMGCTSLGFPHNEPHPHVFVVIESLDRSLSLGVGIHLDKTEPLGAPHITVLDDLGALHCAEGGEPLLQIR